MAASFNPGAAGNIKAVIQFEITGKQPGNWFLTIENDKCKFNEGISSDPSLTIKTPSEIWMGITNKEIDGQQAFIEGKYAVKGDMELLGRMKSFFHAAS
jgi:putative sterol carrier protein